MDLAKLHLHYRSSVYKRETYRSYSLARAYREDGKNRKEIVLKLGKLSPEQVRQWKNALKVAKNPQSVVTTLEDAAVFRHYAYLDVAVANAVWDEWELDKAFMEKGRRELGVATIARILTLNRCIDPTTKSQAVCWFRQTVLPYLLGVEPDRFNASRVFRELAVIEEHKEALCKHVFQRLCKTKPDSIRNVFYDLSSTTFTTARCVLVKWGHCKEGYRNHAVLALVVNEQGIPFYWEVLTGGTTDATTISWLLGRLKERFKVLKTTLVFDRGMVSDNNLDILEKEEIKYISAMDRNQLEGVTGLNFEKFSHLDPGDVDTQAAKLKGFTKINDTMYWCEAKVIGKRRYILCFNPQLFKDQRNARAQAVQNFRFFADCTNEQLRHAKRDRDRKTSLAKFTRELRKAKIDKFVSVTLDAFRVEVTNDKGQERKVRSYQASVKIDEKAMQLAGKLDGFWLAVTNHSTKQDGEFKTGAPDIIKPYRDKVVIESSFRDIKSFIDVSPVHVWREEHVKAHYTICVLAHFIDRAIALRLQQYPGGVSQEVVSHEHLYKELSTCRIDHIHLDSDGASTINATILTERQKDLLNRLGLSHLGNRNSVEKVRATMNA